MANVKNFFRKVGLWFKNHAPSKRRIIQLYAALLTNANIKGFVSGRIYTGATKNACVPGLNCYSCPGAVGACPLGALQDSLAQSDTRTPYYIIGILALFGLMLGRTICGFLCPMGLGQELLYKIKTPKVKKSRYTRLLSYFKYVLLAVLVIAIPLIYNGIPAFCKYICPAGTFEGGLMLLGNESNADLYDALGYLFNWKFLLLVTFIVLCIFFYRFFCRFICPLGAIYGFFNKFALIGVKLDEQKCVDCGRCIQTCKMDVNRVGDHECINCGECIPVCPTKAISWKGSQIFVHGTDMQEREQEVKAPLSAVLSNGTVQAVNAPVTGNAEVSVVLPEGSERTQEEQIKTVKDKIKKRSFWLQFSAWALATAVLITALVFYNFIDTSASVKVYGVGDTCPDFTLGTVYETAGAYDGEGNKLEEFTLSEYRGKVVVLNFWYTTCDPCKEELPAFNSVKEEYGDKIEVVVIHSASQNNKPAAEVQGVISSANNLNASDWNVIFAHDSVDVNCYGMLGGKDAFPMTVILDGNGVITFSWSNKLNEDYLREQIDGALQVEYNPQ